jgi:hypothetical protein
MNEVIDIVELFENEVDRTREKIAEYRMKHGDTVLTAYDIIYELGTFSQNLRDSIVWKKIMK